MDRRSEKTAPPFSTDQQVFDANINQQFDGSLCDVWRHGHSGAPTSHHWQEQRSAAYACEQAGHGVAGVASPLFADVAPASQAGESASPMVTHRCWSSSLDAGRRPADPNIVEPWFSHPPPVASQPQPEMSHAEHSLRHALPSSNSTNFSDTQWTAHTSTFQHEGDWGKQPRASQSSAYDHLSWSRQPSFSAAWGGGDDYSIDTVPRRLSSWHDSGPCYGQEHLGQSTWGGKEEHRGLFSSHQHQHSPSMPPPMHTQTMDNSQPSPSSYLPAEIACAGSPILMNDIESLGGAVLLRSSSAPSLPMMQQQLLRGHNHNHHMGTSLSGFPSGDLLDLAAEISPAKGGSRGSLQTKKPRPTTKISAEVGRLAKSKAAGKRVRPQHLIDALEQQIVALDASKAELLHGITEMEATVHSKTAELTTASSDIVQQKFANMSLGVDAEEALSNQSGLLMGDAWGWQVSRTCNKDPRSEFTESVKSLSRLMTEYLQATSARREAVEKDVARAVAGAMSSLVKNICAMTGDAYAAWIVDSAQESAQSSSERLERAFQFVEAVKMDPVQVSKLSELLRLYVLSVDSMTARRAEVVGQLLQSVDLILDHMAPHDFHVHFLREEQLLREMRELDQALLQERFAFSHAFLASTLSPSQAAVCILSCYPLHPDSMFLACAAEPDEDRRPSTAGIA